MDSSNSVQLVGAFDFKAGPINLFGIRSLSLITLLSFVNSSHHQKESKGFVLAGVMVVIDST